MKVTSLSQLTDLIFAKFSGEVVTMPHYVIIRTPSNPGYHWGNYLYFDRPPRAGDYQAWIELFQKEFPYYENPHHYVFAWDSPSSDTGEIKEFTDQGFELDSGVVLTAKKLVPPSRLNKDIEIKKIESAQQWDDATELQVACSDPKYFNDEYRDFKKKQMASYQEMTKAGKGHWFGAYLGDQLVGDLGIYFEDGLARYQNVGTHPDFRRQGICGTLVFETGEYAFKNFGVHTLVMEADPDYHAARIYESVGFAKKEVNHALSWWKGQGE